MQEQIIEQIEINGLEKLHMSICGGNLQPIIKLDTCYYNELSYDIGPLHYIENAD